MKPRSAPHFPTAEPTCASPGARYPFVPAVGIHEGGLWGKEAKVGELGRLCGAGSCLGKQSSQAGRGSMLCSTAQKHFTEPINTHHTDGPDPAGAGRVVTLTPLLSGGTPACVWRASFGGRRQDES